jgi:6,7-dimethyl-8-ribityllumazine synthase
MLKKVSNHDGKATGPFAIVAARYNAKYVDNMVERAEAALRAAGARRVDIVRVPGSFEIPVVAARLARSSRKYSAVICLGVILRGETTHAHYVADGVTHALALLQVSSGMPIIDGVYLFENETQAKARCLGKKHDRGREVAQAAIQMENVLRSLAGLPKKPEGGFV